MNSCMVKAWSKDQNTIALSSGEAELFAANKAAREGLGFKTMLSELGIQSEVTIEIDASAAQGMMQRRGIGQLRHLEVQQLWTQNALSKGVFKLRKIPNSTNTADLGTKPLSRDEIEENLSLMGFVSPTCVESPE